MVTSFNVQIILDSSFGLKVDLQAFQLSNLAAARSILPI